MQRANLKSWLSGIGGLALLLAVLFMVNALCAGLRVRADLTEDRLYTLSRGTRSLLDDLSRPVTLKFYFSRSNEEMPIPVKQYARRIADLLEEYAAVGSDRVVLEQYDPRPDSSEEEWAQRYGLEAQGMGMLGGNGRLYLGLVAVSGDNEAVLPFMVPTMEPRLEYLITSLIHEVTKATTPTVGLISSLPVTGSPSNPYMGQQGSAPWAFIEQIRRQYKLREIPPDAAVIPADIESLVVMHPKDLSPSLLYALDQFMLRGGRMLVLVDPLCLAEQESNPSMQPQMAMVQSGSDLNRLTKAWGYTMPPGQVAADLAAATPVSMGAGRAEALPAWLTLRGDQIEQDDIVSASLEMLMLPFAGYFEGEPQEGLTAARLLATSPETYAVGTYQAMSPTLDESAENIGAVPLALRLHGEFPGAFPDGPPAGGEQDEQEPAAVPGGHLTSARAAGTAVLVSDCDLLFDRFCVEQMNFFGESLAQPMNDNLNLALNAVEQLSGNEALIGLRSRGTFDRPFDRVLALQQQAQARWQAEEQKLLQRLQETQQRLSQLQQAQRAEDQQYILSEEQQREIEAFREQKFETQQQLKEVRRRLRRDIERLGVRVKVINMALVPALVALFGILYGWRRRRRASGGS